MNLFLIAISSGANYYVKKSNAAYVLGILFITIMDFRILYVAFWKFPDCLGIMIAMSVHLLCHGILEFVYHSALGYFAIVFHTAIWTYAAFASGYIKQNVPVDMKFAMGILLALQLLWYTYKIQKDYEEIKSKLQIKAEQENIQNLVNVIPEGIAVTTQSLEIIMKNSSFDKLLKSCSIFEMKSFSNNTTNQNAIFCKFRNKMEMFRNSEDFEMNFGVWNNGTNFLECTGSKTEWNLLPALVFTFREVSNLIELQKEADFTSKALKILQGVSHELKTPLNLMIHGHEDALFTSKDLSKEVKVHIKKSLSVSYYILSLTKDMIDYSHMKFNNMALEITWVRLDEVLKESVKIMENMNEKCKVVVKKQEKEIFAYTDVCRLKQCLLSFVSTALGQNTKSSVEVLCSDTEQGSQVRILFDSVQNYSLPAKTALNYINKSLKMKISKRILKKINGKIVKKVLADEKMIFIIDFYEKVLESLMSSTENIPNEPQIGPIYKTSGKLIDILIVDDIEFNLEVLKKMIGGLYGTCPCKMPHRPYSLHSAKSGKEAIEKVKYQNSIEGGYRIIVMDCLMPEIDGWEAAKLIKEMYEKNEISVLPCIIAYSAFNSKEDVDKSKLSGMSTHLVKPCTAEELCITIRKWMN